MKINPPKSDDHLVIKTSLKGDEQRGWLKETIIERLIHHKPDLVIVVGDVNSTLAGATAAHELGIKVAHVEAGLRSGDNSMPEEFNRIETDKISDFLFTTEKSGNENLESEGIDKNKIFFVGNVMIDTMLRFKEKSKQSEIFKNIKEKENFEIKKYEYCLLTLHRPSNVDDKKNFENIISILETLQKKIKIIFPIHPRTEKNIELYSLKERINKIKKLKIINPLGYLDFLYLMSNSKLVLTDSGGIQEETTILGIPCITLRNNTERPVTLESEQGTNLLVSIDKDKIIKKSMEVINNEINLKNKIPELWDGKASERIVKILVEAYG